MREQRVPLKDGVDVALVGWDAVDFFAVEVDFPLVWFHKASDDAQRGGFATAGRAKKGDKFLVVNVQIDPFEDALAVKFDHDIF